MKTESLSPTTSLEYYEDLFDEEIVGDVGDWLLAWLEVILELPKNKNYVKELNERIARNDRQLYEGSSRNDGEQ